MSFEVELKLMFKERDLDALCHDERFIALAGHPKKPKSLRSVYFDTPDFTLSKAGIVARLREDGAELLQAVKTPSRKSGIALNRGEYETIVPPRTLAPQMSLLPADVRTHVEGLIAGDPLFPIVETRVERSEIVVNTDNGGVIMLAIDKGHVRSGERSQPLCELELELVTGPPASLYAMALEIVKLAPCTIGLRGKAERGFDLALGTRPCALSAGEAAVTADMTIEGAYLVILDNCLGQFVANLPAVVEQRDGEALHQMRVALRRLRSALALFHGVIHFTCLRSIEKDAQHIARVLGKARDLDVFVADILPPVEAEFPDDRRLAALREAAERERHNAWNRAIRALKDRRVTRLVLRLALALEQKKWREKNAEISPDAPVHEFAATALEFLLKKVVSLGGSLRTLDIDDRHDLRKRMKKLRYSLAFFEKSFDADASAPFSHGLTRLQSQFGSLNDMAVSDEILNRLEKDCGKDATCKADIGASAARIRRYYRKRSDAELKKAIKLWSEFRAVRPFWHDQPHTLS